MEPIPHHCGNCGADTQKDHAAGLTYCSRCGHGLLPQQQEAKVNGEPFINPDLAAIRRRWRQCFWLCFILTPVAAVLTGVGVPVLIRFVPTIGSSLGEVFGIYSVVGTFAVGVLSSGYCLLRTHGDDLSLSETLGNVILYAFGMVVVYIAIIFAGCGTAALLSR